MKKFIGLMALAVGLLLAQQPQPGDLPDETPEQDRPASCDNFHGNAHPCACGKAKHEKCDEEEPDVSMDKRCTTYCRKQNCHCLSKCTT